MTLKSCFRKPYWGLFLQSLKVSSIFPLIAFFGRIIPTFYQPLAIPRENVIGFFWNGYLSNENLISFPILSPFLAVITAVMLFNFAWSKKKTNVLFSFGMTRTQIYSAKLLAGILPLIVLMSIAAVFEIIICLMVGYTLSARYLIGAAFTLLNAITPYILCFCVSSAVIANTANVIEGGVFTLITILAPSVLRKFLGKLFCAYTLGASEMDIERFLDVYNTSYVPQSWNWTAPFMNKFSVLLDDYYYYGEVKPFFHTDSLEQITIYDWSGVIMAVVYSAIAVAVGFYLFRRKKNEHAATFGRTRGFTEFCAVVAGLFIACVLNNLVSFGEGTFTEFIPSIPCFFLGYFTFKQIFGYKRLRELKRSLKRVPLYTAGLLACFICCYLGGFGYSSYVPKTENIAWVSISTPFYKGLDDRLSSSSNRGTYMMNQRDKFDERVDSFYTSDFWGVWYTDEDYYELFTNSVATFYSPDEIDKAREVHEAFIKDGHIRSSAEDTQGTSVLITYRLNDGTYVRRSYFRTTEETAQKLLTLNDTQSVDNEIDFYFGSFDGEYDENTLLKPYDAEEWMTEESDKSSNIYSCNGYLFPKDMSAGYSIGAMDEELFDALREDLKAMSSQEYYHHSAEDELGVLTYIYDTEFTYYNGASEKLSEKLGDDYKTTSWNINPTTAKCFVITKAMTNTVSYLEKSGLMKYFKNVRTVDDISYVKIQTLSKLYDSGKKHLNLPLFYGAFNHDVVDFANSFDRSYFKETDAEKITDKAKIQALLDDAVLFGYCANDSKIVEITYNDGAVATVMVRTAE